MNIPYIVELCLAVGSLWPGFGDPCGQPLVSCKLLAHLTEYNWSYALVMAG